MGNKLPNIRFLCCNFCQEKQCNDDDDDDEENVPRKISINCACFHSQNYIDETDYGEEQQQQQEEKSCKQRQWQTLLQSIKCWRLGWSEATC
jgi:hypothetical protein